MIYIKYKHLKSKAKEDKNTSILYGALLIGFNGFINIPYYLNTFDLIGLVLLFFCSIFISNFISRLIFIILNLKDLSYRNNKIPNNELIRLRKYQYITKSRQKENKRIFGSRVNKYKDYKMVIK